MSVPSSVEELLQLIRKSGMVDESKLTSYLQRRQAGRGLPTDPREAGDAMVRDGLLTAFQAEQFLLGKWRGFTIGKYKLLERVGVGGMGQVFLCEHMFMKRRVAIKVLPPAKAEQPAALGRFYREARAAGSLEHPNIVRTHDIDQDGNLHFIVMEYVDGANLLDIVKKFGPLNLGRAVHYIRQVALGLDFAFRGGIIHRDIKPGNILIDRTGATKLLDLGLARFYKDTTDMLTVKYDDKIVLGTADYVAPEQVANSHAVDVRADIYALGASFYFVLAGHPPFPNGTVSQKLLWHRTKDPTPIRQIRPEVPEALAAIVAKMMHKDVNLRYATPADVLEALEPWDPMEIPAPALEEMPQLSLAALEGVEAPIEQYVAPSSKLMPAGGSKLHDSLSSAGPPSELRSKLMAKPSPFGVPTVESAAPASRTPDANPFNPQRSSPSIALLTPAKPNFGVKSNPFAAPQAEVPTNAQMYSDPTPQNISRPQYGANPGPFPGTFPVIAMPPQDTSTQTRKYIFFGLIAASVAVATMLLTWKFMVAPKAPTQQQDVQVQNG
jgi:eukaryotic-like serine/threonine-protein kinase